MYFVFLNSRVVEKAGTSELMEILQTHKPEYFDYIRKLCPYRMENKILLYELIHKFKRKFHLTEEEAKSILNHFIEEGIVEVGFDDEVELNLLAHETRLAIYALIQRFPGIYINMIRNHLELGVNQTLWHLGLLVELDYIKEHEFGNIKAYAEPEVSIRRIRLGFLVFKKSIRELLIILGNDSKGRGLSDLAEQTKKAKSSLHYSLKKLRKMGIVKKSGTSLQLYKMDLPYYSIFQDVLRQYQQIFAQ